MDTNVDYWEGVLNNPTPPYQALFEEEKNYVREHIPNNSYVLDIGCGNGKNTKLILEKTENVTAIDIDPKAVADAKINLAPFPTVKILQADALSLPFENRVFDVVVLLETIANLAQNKIPVLREINRVLKDSGKIIASVFSEDAFEARMEIYKKLNAPIKEIVGTTVIFDESLGANRSEQFSLDEVSVMADEAGLKITHHKKIDKIAYIFELMKKEIAPPFVKDEAI